MFIGCNGWWRSWARALPIVVPIVVLLATLLSLTTLATDAGAQSIPNPRFSLPIDCEIGVSCFIQNYVDRDPTAGHTDYRCGHLSYDKHKGTDIRIRDLVAMRRGVTVLAAADGVVKAARDGIDDVNVRVAGAESVRDRKAGNAVVLTHGDGYETIYAHLRKGSVVVKKGTRIKRGQRLGSVGLSGLTEFPHLHFEVRFNRSVIDPFTAGHMRAVCDSTTNSIDLQRWLWAMPVGKKLAFVGTGLIQAGFTDRKPDMAAIEERKHDLVKLKCDAPALIFWGLVYGAKKGDTVTLKLFDPNGAILLENTSSVPGNKAQWLRFIGKRLKGGRWPRGTYRGQYQLVRKAGRTETIVVNAQRALSVD